MSKYWHFLLLSCIAACGHPTTEPSATSWALGPFERPAGVNPVVSPDSTTLFFCPMRGEAVAWEGSDTFNPAATLLNGRVVLLYRAEDNSAVGIGQRTSRIGYASSPDGLFFVRHGAPVLFPNSDDAQADNEQPGGCEDPRVVMTDDGLYVMMYTQWNRRQARLAVATSRDLVTWQKHGPAFAKAYGGRFKDDFSKSASVVACLTGGRQVVARFPSLEGAGGGPKYWMYWGESFVNVATSDNLIDWTPLLDADGELLRVMEPRRGCFDSQLTECGPPAVLTEQGIVLIYNGKNLDGPDGDARYNANTYCAGQALFSKDDPTQLLDRLDEPFFVPEADFERSGQYPAGTVFAEGLVYHRDRWLLYYGCADSRVSVAVYNPNKR